MKIIISITNGRYTFSEDYTETCLEMKTDYEFTEKEWYSYCRSIEIVSHNDVLKTFNGNHFIYGWFECITQCDLFQDWMEDDCIIKVENYES